MPSLTHFTNSIDAVVNILSYGFAWQRNDREVISLLLEEVDFSAREPESFGQVCFTENNYESERDKTKFFGKYGIQVSQDWSRLNNLQPVIYVPQFGPVVEAFRFLFTQTYQKALAEKEYPDDKAMQMWVVSSVMANVAGQPLYGSLLRIYQFMEPARHSGEREWRAVNPYPDWSISNSTEKAIKNVSPPKGWAKIVHVLKVEPADIEAIICHDVNETELRAKLPETFREVSIQALKTRHTNS